MTYGTGLLGVEWHQSLGGAIRGLSKSIFPGADYRLGPLAIATVLLLLIDVLPFLGVVFASRAGKMLFGANVLLICTIYGYRARHPKSDTSLSYAALRPAERVPPYLRRVEVRLYDPRQRRHRVAGHEVPA